MEAATYGAEWSIIGLEKLDMDVDSVNTMLSCIANNESKPADGYLQFQFNSWNLGKGSLDTEVLNQLAAAGGSEAFALYFERSTVSNEQMV